MTDWKISLFEPADEIEWERLVFESKIGTILHTREFLAYHHSRFLDRSLAVRDSDGQLTGIFPAAESLSDRTMVVSHPGATFGGLLTAPHVTGAAYRAMMEQALAFWADMGYAKIAYRSVPFIYHSVPRQEDIYVLWRLGAGITGRTLSACIDLTQRLPSSSRRKRSLTKAERSGCTLDAGTAILPKFWPIVESALLERHNARPLHTLEEIQYLASRFNRNIECVCALVKGEIVAGVVLFKSPTVTHVQYSLSSPAGMVAGAMDLLIDRSIKTSIDQGARFFDLGMSTESGGLEFNEGLHQFKMEFGAGTIVYEQYEVDLGPYR